MNVRSARARSGPLAALLLGLAVAACGGANAGGGGGNDPTPTATQQPAATVAGPSLEGPDGLCSFLSQEDAAAALGEPVGAGVPHETTLMGQAWMCRYTGTGSENVLDIEYSTDTNRAEWDDAMLGAGMDEAAALTGLGEAAWLSDTAALGPGTRLAAYEAGSQIWVVIYKDGDLATLQAAVQDVARDLLAWVATLPAPSTGPTAPVGP